jgi:DNA-binding GntR family transcriptional regulator
MPVVATSLPAAPRRRAADIAYDAIESLIATLQLAPGSPVVEAEIAERTGVRWPRRCCA